MWLLFSVMLLWDRLLFLIWTHPTARMMETVSADASRYLFVPSRLSLPDRTCQEYIGAALLGLGCAAFTASQVPALTSKSLCTHKNNWLNFWCYCGRTLKRCITMKKDEKEIALTKWPPMKQNQKRHYSNYYCSRDTSLKKIIMRCLDWMQEVAQSL